MRPKVSVVINCYNGAPYVSEAIDSVYAQTYAEWEIVFWDNMSTDATPSVAQAYDERLRYFRGTEFLPLGAARNQALERCTGELVAFLDSDDVWLPEKLELQIQLLESRPDVGLVYSDCVVQDIHGRGSYFASHVDKFCRGWVFDALMECDFIPLLTVVVRRDVLGAVGPFRSFQIIEDYDMWLRIAAKFQIDYVHRPLAIYRTHAGQWSRQFERALQEMLSVCDSLARSGPLHTSDSERVLKRARARAYHNAASAAMFFSRDPAGCRCYLRASLAYRMSHGAVMLYVLSFFPLPVLIWIRDTKHVILRRWRSRSSSFLKRSTDQSRKGSSFSSAAPG